MKKTILPLLISFFVTGYAFAQEMTPEEEENKLYESVEKEVERLDNYLSLDDWQIFRIDSMLFHDFSKMNAAMKEMSKSKISNSNMYIEVQDEWFEKMYDGFHSILNEEQWAKYLKNGAAKAKKARDKRKQNKNK